AKPSASKSPAAKLSAAKPSAAKSPRSKYSSAQTSSTKTSGTKLSTTTSSPATAPAKNTIKNAQNDMKSIVKNAAKADAERAAIPLKAKAVPGKEEGREKDAEAGPDTPLPLLDLSDAAVKKMIKQAKKRGYITYEQLNQ